MSTEFSGLFLQIMKKKNLLIISCGGHFNSVIEIIKSNKDFNIIGCIDNDKKKIGTRINNLKVLGSDNDLDDLSKKKHINSAFLALGMVKNINQRKELINKISKYKFNFPNFFSKNSLVSKNLKIGFGNIIMHQSLINKNVNLGNFNIINNRSLIEHDVIIGSNVHISTGAIINGNVKIGNNVFIGSGAVITNNKTIKSNTFIKAGQVL